MLCGLLFATAQELLPCGIAKASKPSRTKSPSKIGVFCTTNDHVLWDFTHERLASHHLEDTVYGSITILELFSKLLSINCQLCHASSTVN